MDFLADFLANTLRIPHCQAVLFVASCSPVGIAWIFQIA